MVLVVLSQFLETLTFTLTAVTLIHDSFIWVDLLAGVVMFPSASAMACLEAAGLVVWFAPWPERPRDPHKQIITLSQPAPCL